MMHQASEASSPITVIATQHVRCDSHMCWWGLGSSGISLTVVAAISLRVIRCSIWYIP
jgi:hypothetical protein